MNRFTEESRQEIFQAYWDCGNYAQQCTYLSTSIHTRKVERRRTKDENKPDRYQWRYYVGNDNIEVCRHTFMSIHGIGEGKLRKILAEKRKPSETLASPDMRGKSKFVIIIFY